MDTWNTRYDCLKWQCPFCSLTVYLGPHNSTCFTLCKVGLFDDLRAHSFPKAGGTSFNPGSSCFVIFAAYKEQTQIPAIIIRFSTSIILLWQDFSPRGLLLSCIRSWSWQMAVHQQHGTRRTILWRGISRRRWYWGRRPRWSRCSKWPKRSKRSKQSKRRNIRWYPQQIVNGV